MSPAVLDEDRTRLAPPRPVSAERATAAEYAVPAGHPPPIRRRIRPVPPGPKITFVPMPPAGSLDRTDEQPSQDRSDLALPWPSDAGSVDAWDQRADRLQWWMADLGGPNPVSVETTQSADEVTRVLVDTLGRYGVDVLEANTAAVKGLLPAPVMSAPMRLARWVSRRPPVRPEMVEVRLEAEPTCCRVSARAGGERAAEALRVALSDLDPTRRPPR